MSFIATLTPALLMIAFYLIMKTTNLEAFCFSIIFSWFFVFGMRFKERQKDMIRWQFSIEYTKKYILPFAFQGVITFIVPIYFQVFVRKQISQNGEFETAVWQLSWSLNLALLSLLTASFATILLPHFSSKNLKEAMNIKLLTYFILLFAGVLTLQIVNIYFGEKILAILYSEELSQGHGFFTQILQIQYLKLACWILGLILIAKAKIKTIIITDLIFYIFLGLIAFASPDTFYQNFILYAWGAQTLICMSYIYSVIRIYRYEN